MLNFKKKKTLPKDSFKTSKNLNLNEIKYEEIWSDGVQPIGNASYKVEVIENGVFGLIPINIISFTSTDDFYKHYGFSSSDLILGSVDFVMELDKTFFTKIDDLDALFHYKEWYDFYLSNERYIGCRPKTTDLIVSETYENRQNSRISFSHLRCSCLRSYGNIWIVGFSMNDAYWNLIDYSCPIWFKSIHHDANKPFVRELKLWHTFNDNTDYE